MFFFSKKNLEEIQNWIFIITNKIREMFDDLFSLHADTGLKDIHEKK
jgi:hypothetical protein